MLFSALLEAARKANFKGTFSQIAEGFATERYINFMIYYYYYYFGIAKLFLIEESGELNIWVATVTLTQE